MHEYIVIFLNNLIELIIPCIGMRLIFDYIRTLLFRDR